MRLRIAWLVLAAVPLACVLHMWIATDGLPYNTDSNESFSAFVQGKNLLQFDPRANAFLTDDANASHPDAHPFTYTHGPNLPRYFSAALSLLGVHTQSWQILVTAIVTTLLSLWFIGRSFPQPLAGHRGMAGVSFGLLMAALFAVDFLGVLQFLGNLWRAWHFPLFWGCIWAVRTRAHWSAGFMLFFLLFQIEFLFAAFTGATVACYLLWTHRHAMRALLHANYLAMLAGAAASIAVFIGQLTAFYGWQGFLFDLQTTFVARNSNRIEWEAIRQFYESHAIMMWPSSPESDFRFAVYLKITWENMVRRLSPVLAAAVLLSFLLSVLLALFAALTGRARNHAHFQAAANEAVGPLLWAMFAAYLLLGVAIPGYTLNGYTWRWAPLLVFPVTVAQALLVANAAALISASSLSSFWPFRRRSEVPLAAALLAAAAGVSLYQYGEHPNFVHTPATALSTTYKGHSFVSATTFPHMIAQYTGRWAYYSPLVFSGDERLDQTHNWNADRNRNRDYETPEYYLCQTLPYNRTIDCSEVANKMSALGHEVAERGPGYVVVKLSWKLPALDGETSGRKTAAEPR